MAESELRVRTAANLRRRRPTQRGAQAPNPSIGRAGRDRNLRLLGVALLMQGKSRQRSIHSNTSRAAPESLKARVDLARAYRSGTQPGRLHRLRCEQAGRLVAPGLACARRRTGRSWPSRRRSPGVPQGTCRILADRIARAYAAFGRGRVDHGGAPFGTYSKADASHVGALCGLAAIYRGADGSSRPNVCFAMRFARPSIRRWYGAAWPRRCWRQAG